MKAEDLDGEGERYCVLLFVDTIIFNQTHFDFVLKQRKDLNVHWQKEGHMVFNR